MKKLLVASLIAVVFLFAGCSSSGNNGGVIGSVNGANVYQDEYDYYFALSYQYAFEDSYTLFSTYGPIDLMDEESAHDALADFEYQAWDSVVNIALIEQLAAEYEIEAEETYLKDILPWGHYHNIQISTIYMELIDAVREEMLAEVEVLEEDIQAAYDEDSAAWDSRSTSHILIACDVEDPDAVTAAKIKAEGIIDQLDDGADFVQMAVDNSDDGSAEDGGVIDSYINAAGNDIATGGGFFPEYVEEAYALNAVGDYSSEPVLSSAGYHIVKLDDIKEGYEALQEDVADSLRTISDEAVYYRINDLILEAKDNAEINRKFDFKYYEEPEVEVVDVPELAEDIVEDEATTDEDSESDEATDDTTDEAVDNDEAESEVDPEAPIE